VRVLTALSLIIGLSAAVTPAGGPPVAADRIEPGMSAEANKVYRRTDALMRALHTPGNAERMLESLLPVARQQRHPLLLSRLVVAAAAVASAPDGPRRVDGLVANARRAGADDLDAFVAGVAAHYRGHVRGDSRAAKSADYKLALELLEPLREPLGASPRLWIYLAVSYLRTGRQQQAAAAIERAGAADDGGDADVYYCRAEVWHRTDPGRAIGDIDRYIAIMQRNKAHGAWAAPDKEKKVAVMRAHLAAVAAGRKEAGSIELFDPIRVPPADDGMPKWLWEILVVLGVTAFAAWRWTRRQAG